MFRLDLVILRPILTFVLPDTVHTLGSHRVYIRRIHLVKTLSWVGVPIALFTNL